MTSPENPTLSEDLLAWAREAGYAFTPADSSNTAVLWSDPGGEIRFYIRCDGAWFSLSRAERQSVEDTVVSAPAIGTIERFLFDVFGPDIRTANRLPWLKVPTKREELAPGHDIIEGPNGFIDLVIDDRTHVARGRSGRLGTMNLVLLSYLHSASINDIKNTYIDVSGRPIFPQADA